MSRLRAKLKSRRGAAAIIALMFFLLCLTVGCVVLTAATASAGRLQDQRRTQQDYFTVSSAARLLRDQLHGATFVATVTTEGDGTPTKTFHVTSKVLESVLKEDATAASGLGTKISHDRKVTIEAGEGWEPVKGTMTMAKASEAAPYQLTITLWLEKESEKTNKMTLTVPAFVTNDTQEEKSETEAGGETVTTIETTQVTWGMGTITKGARNG